MLPGFLLTLREGLEAALIVGIVLGALQKMHRPELRSAIWWGVGTAVALSLAVGFGLSRVGLSLEGAAEEAFEGLMMLAAAMVLTWMIFWMNRFARQLKTQLEGEVRLAASASRRGALFSLAFLAVLREGIELALFLTAAAMTSGGLPTVLGAALGLCGAVFFGWALFASTIRLDLRRFFQVTSILLVLFAAGLVAHAVHEFNELGWIPPLIEEVWNMNSILPEQSWGGQLLTALFGYNANPSLSEVLAYGLYWIGIGLGLLGARRHALSLPTGVLS
ncbi:MAG: Ferrous iron transport permease EfeU [Anaerolineae bacterium]|nr:MAG: Ferrous iron transport permease EfeU [Anaerolineae bacterium]